MGDIGGEQVSEGEGLAYIAVLLSLACSYVVFSLVLPRTSLEGVSRIQVYNEVSFPCPDSCRVCNLSWAIAIENIIA